MSRLVDESVVLSLTRGKAREADKAEGVIRRLHDVASLPSNPRAIRFAIAPLIAISGAGVFSFGNDTALGSSATDYLNTQELLRDNTVTIIPTTPGQDKAVLDFLAGFIDKNGVGLCDNCANRTIGALQAAGILPAMPGFVSYPPLPAQVSIVAGGALGATTTEIPQGSAGVDLSKFNPTFSLRKF